MSTFRRLISYWSGAFVVSGACREAAMLSPWPSAQTTQTVAQIERRLTECLASFAATKDEAVKDRLRTRIDELLDERNLASA